MYTCRFLFNKMSFIWLYLIQCNETRLFVIFKGFIVSFSRYNKKKRNNAPVTFHVILPSDQFGPSNILVLFYTDIFGKECAM